MPGSADVVVEIRRLRYGSAAHTIAPGVSEVGIGESRVYQKNVRFRRLSQRRQKFYSLSCDAPPNLVRQANQANMASMPIHPRARVVPPIFWSCSS